MFWAILRIAPSAAEPCTENDLVAIVVSRRAAKTIQRELRLYSDVETGGVLFGLKIGCFWIVFCVSSSGKRSIRSAASFQADIEELAQEAQQILNNSMIPMKVLGIWHKHNHNYSPLFSTEDEVTNFEYAQLNSFGAISLLASKDIDGYSYYAVHVSTNNCYTDERLLGL